MRADASGQFSLLVISHHLRATEVCAAAEQPLADLAQCFGWLEHVACDFTHHLPFRAAPPPIARAFSVRASSTSNSIEVPVTPHRRRS